MYSLYQGVYHSNINYTVFLYSWENEGAACSSMEYDLSLDRMRLSWITPSGQEVLCYATSHWILAQAVNLWWFLLWFFPMLKTYLKYSYMLVSTRCKLRIFEKIHGCTDALQTISFAYLIWRVNQSQGRFQRGRVASVGLSVKTTRRLRASTKTMLFC